MKKASRPEIPGVEKRIVLQGQEVRYRLTRSVRKRIGLTIDRAGLRVGAPLATSQKDIERALDEHGEWVLKKLVEWQQRPEPHSFCVENGASVRVLGQAVRLEISAGARRSLWLPDARLLLRVPSGESPALLLEMALRRHVRQHFAERIALLAARLGVKPPPFSLSSARTRWGSCNSRGVIRLNWRLVFMPPAVVDYVVAHELAHLKEMNHGEHFWAWVEVLCPDWQAQRLELKRLAADLPHFAETD